MLLLLEVLKRGKRLAEGGRGVRVQDQRQV
jgi:hypothetical protein